MSKHIYNDRRPITQIKMNQKRANYDDFKLKKTFGLHGLYEKFSAL